MKKSSFIIPLIFLATGFASAYLIYGYPEKNLATENNQLGTDATTDNIFSNPFSTKQNNAGNNEINRIAALEDEIIQIKQQLHEIKTSLQVLSTNQDKTTQLSSYPAKNNNRFVTSFNRRPYSIENLIRGGIEPSLAEDIVRRKNSIELKRLELQDRATREKYLNTPRYFDELEQINNLDVSLREELGDARYDEYLFNSKQNNRIRISSVMLGSAAEQAGIQKNDVVLSYNNKNMYTWQELKDATAKGTLGEYVSISIYRNGEIFSFSVPRGALGIQLGATRLQP